MPCPTVSGLELAPPSCCPVPGCQDSLGAMQPASCMPTSTWEGATSDRLGAVGRGCLSVLCPEPEQEAQKQTRGSPAGREMPGCSQLGKMLCGAAEVLGL